MDDIRDRISAAIEQMPGRLHSEKIDLILDAFRAAQPEEGEKAIFVPRNPTEEMMSAGLYHCSADMTHADLWTAWQAMFDTLALDGGCTTELPADLSKPRPDREAVIERIAVSFSDKAILLLGIPEESPVLSRIVDEMREEIAALLPAEPVQEMRDLEGWREIASAPKDGTRIVAWWPHIGRPVVAWVAQGGRKRGTWTCSILPSITATPTVPPTHWRPLPPPPTGLAAPQEQGEKNHG